MAEKLTIFDISPEERSNPNPLWRRVGAGPEGKKCKTCSHLYFHEYSKRYYKCDLRPHTHGPGTDHRVNWMACGLYESKSKQTGEAEK